MEQKDTLCGLRSAEITPDGLKLVLNNTLAAVEDGRQQILGYLGPLDPMAQNRLEVLFEELVANIIRHGFSHGSHQSIHVQIERREGAIQLTFEDDGAPFNLLEAEAPEPFTDIETARVGGLGIPLARKMARTLRYERLSSPAGGFRPNNRIVASVAS